MTLRPLEVEDADVIAGWGTDLQFCREADWTVDRPVAERQRALLSLIQSPPLDLVRLGAVHEGVLIGYVDLHGDEPVRRELGFLIGGRDRWGHGLGRLTAAAGLDYGFDELGLQQVWAEALDANHRSVNILRRLGLDEIDSGTEGVFDAQPSQSRRYAIAAKDWATKRTTHPPGTTSPGAPPRVRPAARSNAASPATSTDYSKVAPSRLNEL